jgi:hypothetical protein
MFEALRNNMRKIYTGGEEGSDNKRGVDNKKPPLSPG